MATLSCDCDIRINNLSLFVSYYKLRSMATLQRVCLFVIVFYLFCLLFITKRCVHEDHWFFLVLAKLQSQCVCTKHVKACSDYGTTVWTHFQTSTYSTENLAKPPIQCKISIQLKTKMKDSNYKLCTSILWVACINMAYSRNSLTGGCIHVHVCTCIVVPWRW